MWDWLRDDLVQTEPGWSGLVTRLSTAAATGLIVAVVYSLSQRRRLSVAGPLPTTLVLLTVLVAMTTLVIGNSVARAFGLVGALSIVRFRTVVDDTRDTAFVIFAVVVGMAIGAGYLTVCLVGVPLVALVALALGRLSDASAAVRDEQELVVRVSLGVEPEELFAASFREHVDTHRLRSVFSARQGAALDLHYAVQLRSGQSPLPLVRSLHQLSGVQGVELKDRN